MKFADLSAAWQACFYESWQAYRANAVPIGAAITDAGGRVLYQSRNRIPDLEAPPRQTCNSQLSHAELNTILMIEGRPAEIHSWHIYSLVEPCPLCMGAIYMAGLRNIHYAAPDGFAGSTNLLGTTPYLSKKPVRVHDGTPPAVREIAIALQMEFNLRRGERFLEVVDVIRSTGTAGVTLGERVFGENTLQQFLLSGITAGEVYDELFQRFISLESA